MAVLAAISNNRITTVMAKTSTSAAIGLNMSTYDRSNKSDSVQTVTYEEKDEVWLSITIEMNLNV